jgi:predicted amidohydrolase
MHDIVIRGGSIIDGSRAPAFTGDVAIAQGRIAAVGGKQGPARREIDADGRRAGDVGSAARALVLAWRHHGCSAIAASASRR